MTRKRSGPSRLRRVFLEEREQQPADLLGLFLLYPVPRAVDPVEPDHVRARRRLHAVDRARRLVDAPIAFPPDELRRDVDAAAREGAHLSLAFGIGAAPHAIALQRAGELRARIFA